MGALNTVLGKSSQFLGMIKQLVNTDSKRPASLFGPCVCIFVGEMPDKDGNLLPRKEARGWLDPSRLQWATLENTWGGLKTWLWRSATRSWSRIAALQICPANKLCQSPFYHHHRNQAFIAKERKRSKESAGFSCYCCVFIVACDIRRPHFSMPLRSVCRYR